MGIVLAAAEQLDKAAETTNVAYEIIFLDTTARRRKTDRYRKARMAVEKENHR